MPTACSRRSLSGERRKGPLSLLPSPQFSTCTNPLTEPNTTPTNILSFQNASTVLDTAKARPKIANLQRNFRNLAQ